MRDKLRTLFEVGEHPLTAVTQLDDAALPGLSHLTFHTRAGEPVRGFWLRPKDVPGPCPAVLVIHAHGGRYDIGADELIQGRPALDGPIGPTLATLGIATLCLDMPCFGARSGHSESARSKALLWEGKSLAGQMLGECAAALDWLSVQPDVRADRIGVFGISMGATLGYWLAAVDPRVRALAQECCLADFRALIATGAHDLHGPYLTIPGLLTQASNGAIAGLVAPRAQFIGIGDTDPLTPPEAADIALAEVRAAYDQTGGQLVIHREPKSGHQETPEMRRAALAFLTAALA